MQKKIHITQDEHGFWFMSLEEPDGTLKLLAHHFASPNHLIEDAHEMASAVKGNVFAADSFLEHEAGADIVVVADPPRTQITSDPAQWPADYQPPKPKKAGE